jgi:hypothetical protein
MRTETDQPEDRQGGERQHGAREHLEPFAGARGREHQERQHQAGRHLDADARHERACGGAEARVGAGRQRERGRQHQQDQRVVVRPADRQHEQYRVQPNERRRPAPGVPEATAGSHDQRHRAQAARDRQRLERPQPAGQPQRSRRVAREREQRTVGGVLERPSDEREDGVGRGFRRHVRIRVESVQSPHPPECQVPEHVLGDQRRAEQQDHVGRHDRDHQRAHRQCACREQDE